jgi:xylulokinase
MGRLLGIDIGTSSAKGLLIDSEGRILGSAVRTYPLSAPRPGWAEQDAEDWVEAAASILNELGADGLDGIGLTGQMHGSVAVGEDGRALAPALLWCDQRTSEEAAWAESEAGPDRVRAITGNPVLTGFQLPKLIWMQRHMPDVWARTRQVLLPKDYVRLRLFGELATDASDASGTCLLDLRSRSWSQELCEAWGIAPSLLPPVRESWAETARWKGAPVAAGAGDQAAAAVGTGAVHPGLLSVSLGTSGVVFRALDGAPDPREQKDAVHDFCHAQGGWHRMGVMLSCGSAISWVRDMLFPGEPFEALTRAAEDSEPGAKGVVFLPHLSGERCPIVDPGLRASFHGISVGHTRSDLARAVLEGICLNLAECLEELGAPVECEVAATSGAAKSPFFLRLLASALGRPCRTRGSDEGPAYGAAILGGAAAGIWPDVASASRSSVEVGPGADPEAGLIPESLRERARILRRLGPD